MARGKRAPGQENLYRRGEVWWVRFVADGIEHRKSTGQRALADARSVRGQVIESVRPKPLGSARGFGEMVDRYFDNEAKSLRPTTQERYFLSAKALAAMFGPKDLSEISRKDVSDYISRRRAGEVTDATIRRDLATLSIMLNAAVQWEWLDSNPIRRVSRRGLKEVQRTRYLTKAEWTKLAKACDPTLRAICTIAVEAGLRLGEILNLEWRDIDKARREIRVREGKTGGRTVPASAACLAALPKRERAGGALFWQQRADGPEKLKVARVSQRFAKAAERAKLRDVRFHDLRHTFASWKVQDGHDLYPIQRALGHKGPQMTQRYAHLRTQDLHRLVKEK